MITDEKTENFLRFVKSYDAFIIAGHKEPDGDCLASCLALCSLLEYLNKKSIVVSAGPFKRPETRQYEKLFKKEKENGSWFSDSAVRQEKTALIIADCSELSRLGDIAHYFEDMPSFVIDHHKTSVCDPLVSIIDSSAPATAFLVQQLYERIAGSIPEKTAKLLFFGLATDTGYFRFLDGGSSGTFYAAGRLIERGANPRQVYDDMSGGKTFASRKLLAVLLERTELHFDGRLALTWETLEDTHTFASEGRDSDALYQLLLAVDTVCVIAVVRQENEEKCTVGLRSREPIDVSGIAASYGGGGHKNAAGLTVNTSLEQIIPRLLQDFSKIL